MGSFDRECFVVAYEHSNGKLIAYAGMMNPERIATYDAALKLAQRFNQEPGSRLSGATTEWRVYKMKFEEIDDKGEEARTRTS